MRMGDHSATWFGHSTGPVSSGSGHQFIRPHIEQLIVIGQGGVPAWQNGDAAHWTTDHLLWLQRRYEHPIGYREAEQVLDDSGAVLLVGDAGSGRRAAAIHLLIGDQDVRDVRIRVLRKWWSEQADDEPSRIDLITPGEGLLLDLTDVGDGAYDYVCSTIHGLLGKVADNGARLAVIDRDRPETNTELERLRARLERPDTRAAFWKYIKAESLWSSGLTLDKRHAGHLESIPLRVLPRIMTLIAQGSREGLATTAECIHQAFQTLMHGKDSFDNALAAVPDIRGRALLLTGALFNELPVDAIYLAHAKLLKTLSSSGGEGIEARPEGLASPGFIKQLDDCRIKVGDDPMRRVRFADLDLGARVLSHFWDNYPDLRRPLFDWVLWAASSQPNLSMPDRARIVSRFAAEALRANRPGDLFALASALMSAGGVRGSERLTYILLAAGLDSGYHSSRFRRYLYDKAGDAPRRGRLTPNYAEVLINLCVDRVAPNYPDQAVTRLHRFCAAADEQIGNCARDALLELIQRDARAQRWLVRRIVDVRGGRTRLDPDLFSAAVSPTSALDGRLPPIPDADLVSGWRLVIAADTTAELAEHLAPWLASCLCTTGADGDCDRALRTLARAASPAFALQSRLEAAAARWADMSGADVGSRRSVADRLSTRIDHAVSMPGDGALD